jgi:hypothetical protein
MKIRKEITLDPELKEQFREYAYRQRTTMGALTGKWAHEYGTRTETVKVDPEPRGTWSVGKKTDLKFVAFADVWRAAQIRAHEEGTTVPLYLRARIRGVL